MSFISFDSRKPKEFKFEPRYTDPVKDAERKKKYEEEGNTEKLRELRRMRFEQEWKSGKRQDTKRKVQRKILIYAILAAALLAFILLFPTK